MPRPFRTLNHFLKKKYQDGQKESLVCHMSSGSADEDPRQQTGCLIDCQDQCAEDSEDSVLPVLTDALTGDIYFQELKDAAEQVKQLKKQNSVSSDVKRDSQCGLKEYLRTVEMFVDKHFPEIPTSSQPLNEDYLNDAMCFIYKKVTCLVPVLEDSQLVSYLLDSYNRHLFDMLRLLMDKSSSVKDYLFLLQWVKNSYFSQDHKGCQIKQSGVLSVSDPFLLSDWLEYSKQKLLTLVQEDISTTLHNILQHDDPNGICEDSNEETFIQVQLDVIQCLNAPIEASKTVSHTMKTAVQRLCCDELHNFIQRYVNAQRVDEATLSHDFRIIYTCRQLRSYALCIIDSNNNTDSSTLLLLKNLETQALSNAQQRFANIAKDNLKNYFSKDDVHLNNMIIIIKNMIATLPQVELGNETKELIVKAAYHSITRSYLDCLLQRKYKKLEKRWSDVGKKIMWDAEKLHFHFAQQSGSDDKQKTLLLKMGEILQCHNADTLKLLCSALRRHSDLTFTFPKESEAYISALLRWRGKLPRRQIKEIIDVSRVAEEHNRNGDHVRPHPYMCLWCCLR